MASDINAIFIVGRMVRNPELKYTQSGTAVCSFSIANNRAYVTGGEKKEQVSYFNCVAWAKIGEVIAEYCKKGSRIGIEGRLKQRSWEDQDGKKRSTLEIVVDNFQFLDSKPQGDKRPEEHTDPPPVDTTTNPFGEDLPF